MSDVTLEDLANKYYIARGFDTTNWGMPTGKKFMEEALELYEAIIHSLTFVDKTYKDSVKDEVGDVAITLAYIAEMNGFTVEQAVRDKTEKDRGRGYKTSDPFEALDRG